MSRTVLMVARIVTGLVFLAMVAMTVWFAVQGAVIGIVACAALAVIFGLMLAWDIKRLLKQQPPQGPGG